MACPRARWLSCWAGTRAGRRRLALLEKLAVDVRQEMEVGLLTPTVAREIARLPAGNQSEVLELSRREAVSRDELGGVVRLLLGS